MTLIDALQKFSDLKQSEGKDSTVRKLSFCLRKLESFPDISLEEIDREWVVDFKKCLVEREGLTPNTAATYLRLIYSSCRHACRNGADIDLNAFIPSDMANSPAVSPDRLLAPLRLLAGCDFHNSETLSRARAIYLSSFLMGGVSLQRMLTLTRREIESGAVDVDGRMCRIPSLVNSLLEEVAFSSTRYLLRKGRGVITDGALSRRKLQLDACLSMIGIRLGCRGAFVYDDIPVLHSRIVKAFEGDVSRLTAALSAASPRWFAIRCVRHDSASLSRILSENYPAADIFIPETDSWQHTVKGVKKKKVQLLRNIFFIHAPLSVARRMRTEIRDFAYVYTLRDGDSREIAVIPDHEMKMFLYFNDIAPDEIGWYIEDEDMPVAIVPDSRVVVTKGKWQGAVGKVVDLPSPSPDQIMVAIEFPNLGITVTCPVPVAFLSLGQP